MTTVHHATTSVATHRVFATGVSGHTRYVHDPLTGLTHRADDLIPLGRARLSGAAVASWPTVHPGDLDRTMPVSVCWSPLVRCNLACPHCLDDKSVPELARTQRQRIAEVLGKSGVLAVDISGGEPLLLRDLGALAAALTGSGCAVSVTTNGWHLERRAPALADQVDAVRVSLDGADASSHDRWRGAGSFHRAVAGVRAAVAHGLPTRLQIVLMASTHRSAQRLVDLAGDLGVASVTFLQMLPIGDGAALAHQESLTDEQARAVIADLDIPESVTVRLRTRDDAGGFTVVRADGHVWRNDRSAEGITTLLPLTCPSDLAVTGRDSSE